MNDKLQKSFKYTSHHHGWYATQVSHGTAYVVLTLSLLIRFVWPSTHNALVSLRQKNLFFGLFIFSRNGFRGNNTVTTNRITWVSIPASACAVCTQCPRSAHAVQELSPGPGASIGQVWTCHLAPAAPASRPSSPTQFHDCSCHADSALQFVPSLLPGWGKSRAASTGFYWALSPSD